MVIGPSLAEVQCSVKLEDDFFFNANDKESCSNAPIFFGDRVNALHGISPINKAGQKVKYYQVRTLRSSLHYLECFVSAHFPRNAIKAKAAKTEGNLLQIAEVEVCHNGEEMFPADWTDEVQFPDSEDEYIAEQAEGAGPPSVSQEPLKEFDERAALDELEKLHQMNVIEPTT